jgi:hypothetical protein
MMVETICLYKKPEGSTAWSEEQRTGIFNQILTISTLTGIEYFSTSRNAPRIFFEFSYVVDGPNGRRAIPDPVHVTPPATYTLFTRQKDSTFGDNFYRYDYVNTPNAFFFVQENLSSLTIAFIPVVGRGNLRSVMAVFDCEDSLLIYAVSIANAFSLSFLQERIGNSFEERVEAMLRWFSSRADLVFLPQ